MVVDGDPQRGAIGPQGRQLRAILSRRQDRTPGSMLTPLEGVDTPWWPYDCLTLPLFLRYAALFIPSQAGGGAMKIPPSV